jgi:hypothetical protein
MITHSQVDGLSFPHVAGINEERLHLEPHCRRVQTQQQCNCALTAAAFRRLMACAVTPGSTDASASTSSAAALWLLPAAEAGLLPALLPPPAAQDQEHPKHAQDEEDTSRQRLALRHHMLST